MSPLGRLRRFTAQPRNQNQCPLGRAEPGGRTLADQAATPLLVHRAARRSRALHPTAVGADSSGVHFKEHLYSLTHVPPPLGGWTRRQTFLAAGKLAKGVTTAAAAVHAEPGNASTRRHSGMREMRADTARATVCRRRPGRVSRDGGRTAITDNVPV